MSLLLFLDTNVLLSFFHFADDDLESLRQLTELVKEQEVVRVQATLHRRCNSRLRDLRVKLG